MNDPEWCNECGGYQTERMAVRPAGATIEEEMMCLGCGAKFTNTYTLSAKDTTEKGIQL